MAVSIRDNELYVSEKKLDEKHKFNVLCSLI